jgi:NADPH:quinone reductase-like Zn-dependent oxidoreductase
MGDIETPRPGPGQLLVKIEAAALAPVDWMIQKSGLLIDAYPVILGLDVAGIVEDIGEGVLNFVKGDKVYVTSIPSSFGCLYINALFDSFYQSSFWNNSLRGGFQQYNIRDAETTAKVFTSSRFYQIYIFTHSYPQIPPNLSFEMAAALPTAIATALVGLYSMKPHGAGLTLPLDITERGKNSGQPLLVFGGATSVGQIGTPILCNLH